MIKLFKAYVSQEAKDEVEKTLDNGFIGQGEKVEEFESKFKEKFNLPYALSVNSGTSAIETALDVIGIGRGHEIITTPLTCTATNLPVLARKYKIVWADIKRDTLCIDPEDVFRKLTKNTRAIINVHLGGVESYLPNFNKFIINDACQALGIFTRGITCCSFQAIKHITTGDGGMVCFPDQWMHERGKLIRWFGIDRSKQVSSGWEGYKTRMMAFDIEVMGYKRHMNDITASMGIGGLAAYDRILAHRKMLADTYYDLLKDNYNIHVVRGERSVNWLMTILTPDRDNLAKKLYGAGVESNVVQVRNDTYRIFGGKRQNLPMMNEVEDQYLNLPIGMHVTKEEVEHICSVING